MDIYIKDSKIIFKAPQIGSQTMPIEAHYNGRRVTAEVDSEERMFVFKKDELAFDVTEEQMKQAIEDRIIAEQEEPEGLEE